MKKPTRVTRARNKDSAMEKRALQTAVTRLAQYNANPSSAAARPKGTKPAAPWAIQAGSKIAGDALRKKLDTVNAKMARDDKNAKRLAAAQARTKKK
jgi:hypothetical protein